MDIHNFWGHIKNSAKQISNSFWMNHNLWVNDPDFAIVRTKDNSTTTDLNMPYTQREWKEEKDFWMAGPESNEQELKVWLSIVRVTGGTVFLSDSIRDILPTGREKLDKLFPPLTAGHVPLDLFEGNVPSYWLSKSEETPTLLIVNWDDEEKSFAVPAEVKAEKGRDFWSGEEVDFCKEVSLGGRDCILVEF
jgi:hypothetical protein